MSQQNFGRVVINVPQTSQSFLMAGAEITAKVKIKKDYRNQGGTCAIFIACFIKGRRVRIPTGLKVKLNEFNEKTERVRNNHPEALDYNLMIEHLLTRIHELRVKQRLGDIDLNPESFRELVLSEALSADFLAYMIYKVEGRKNELAFNSYRHHKATHGLMVKCFKQLPYAMINDESLYKFRKFMEHRGAKEVTISDKIKHIKVYLRMAQKEGMKFTMPSNKALKVAQPKSLVQALTREQLKRAIELYQKQYLDEGQQQVLRLFLFSCFTGLRYGDVQSLTRENFIDRYLVLTPQKTKKHGKILKIPVSKSAMMLVDLNSDKPLGHVISNQKVNSNLKKIQAYLKMDRGLKLHFHMSRHTFATQFLELGGDIEVLQTLLGHGSLKQTMIYAHVIDKRRENQIDNFDQLL